MSQNNIEELKKKKKEITKKNQRELNPYPQKKGASAPDFHLRINQTNQVISLLPWQLFARIKVKEYSIVKGDLVNF